MTRIYLVLAMAAFPMAMLGQFSSGSTGADGALNLTTSGTVVLDPATLPAKCANNVCNFTSITIGPNTVVTLLSRLWRNSSVVWLSQGDVNIQGTVNADGTPGASMNAANPSLNRFPAAPGPGGFPGGVGGYLAQPAQPGAGFGGGAAGNANAFNGGQGVYSHYNNQLTPFLGGSGGGGGYQGTAVAGGNGGGGGGALRIVSTTSITVSGVITANAGQPSGGVGSGNAGGGGPGSGGAIHLIAPTVSGQGSVSTSYGSQPGVVEISATTNTIVASHINGAYIAAGLYAPPLPSGVPAVQITSVNNVNAPQFPNANPMVPDVTINSSAPVSVAIATQNIPTNTTVTLFLTSENAPDTKVTCGALSGTIQSATATCSSVNFPSGVTITDILAVW